MHFRFLFVAYSAFLSCSVAHAACQLGPGLNPSGYESFMCLQQSKIARLKNLAAPECIRTFRKDARESFDKAKGCMKKEKNSEGLRALGEYWAAWNEALDVMSSGTPEEMEPKVDAARRKLLVLDAVN
jgi:hypothetical protein